MAEFLVDKKLYFYLPHVDMSDVVTPEVRPKPAVPAKPPNVGAPSPSSSFPPQGPGIGGGGVSAPPPSGIPVSIGNHGLGHVGSHSVGHSVGHGGGHAGVHSGGHGHSGSHGSSGGSTLLGYIGIDTIIEQMRKKTMKTGFDFNIMVVGKSQWDLSLGFCSCRKVLSSFLTYNVVYFIFSHLYPCHLRSQRFGKVNSCEHLIQVPGEQEEHGMVPR